MDEPDLRDFSKTVIVLIDLAALGTKTVPTMLVQLKSLFLLSLSGLF